jgi:hypothetical protein
MIRSEEMFELVCVPIDVSQSNAAIAGDNFISKYFEILLLLCYVDN